MAKVVAVHPLNRARERRAHAHEPQQQQEEEEAEEQPHFLALQPPPHYQYQQFPEGFNWEQLQGDVHQMKGDLHHLREDVDQLKETQQQQWSQVNQNIQQLQGGFENLKEQQDQINWREIQGSLGVILERQLQQMGSLAEFRHLYEERAIARGEYDGFAQTKLSYLCNAVANMNPNYPTYMQKLEELSSSLEEIAYQHKKNVKSYMRRLGFWKPKPKDYKGKEGSSKPDKGGSSPSKKKDKGKGPTN
ncbi:uncharacterized protein LOC130975078 [Arachis stenosperma]|uniref:uncharacterized protein LOC130975078 n=1 Tax=Arachis stenosperma TaxID=217475 RepID=UPI0025ACAA32|nr:uncharacterized protein LOC130975078 [Arachis stenosperma]